MQKSELLAYLKSLEMELHQPKCRSDRDRLNELLHDSFIEFGKSGRIFTKHTVIQELSEEGDGLNVLSQDYLLQLTKDGTALVTYKSALIKNDGTVHGFANRSSYWVFEDDRWQMCFHQGTPADELGDESV